MPYLSSLDTLRVPLGGRSSAYYGEIKHFKCHIPQISEPFKDHLVGISE